MGTDKFHRCVKMRESERNEMLAALDSYTKEMDSNNKRGHQRANYRGHDISVTVTQSNGHVSSFLTCSRNISAGGLSTLINSFVYDQSPCEIYLDSLWGESTPHKGKIIRCRHVSGQIHEIGIEFSEPIDPRCYSTSAEGIAVKHDPVDIPDLSGTILYLDDDEAQLRLFRHLLRSSKLKVELVNNPEETLQKLRDEVYDLFLCDLNLGQKITGEDVIRSARDGGFTGNIIAIIGEISPKRLRVVKNCGTSDILLKPYHHAKMFDLLALSLKSCNGSGENNPIYSSLGNDESTRKIVELYIKQLASIKADLKTSTGNNDIDSVLEICRKLGEVSGSYGFPEISDASQRVATSLKASKSLKETNPEILRLTSVIDRANVAPKAA